MASEGLSSNLFWTIMQSNVHHIAAIILDSMSTSCVYVFSFWSVHSLPPHAEQKHSLEQLGQKSCVGQRNLRI